MDENPYIPPQLGPTGDDVPKRIRAPALALAITMGIALPLVLISLVMNLTSAGIGAAGAGNDDPQAAMAVIFGGLGAVSAGIGLIVGSVVLFGAVQMMKGRNYGFSFASCILAMVPILSPCCILGLPFGIWGIVVLSDPQVKAYFNRA